LSTTVGSISAAGDNGDGTYTATLTSTTAAMATITGTVNGSAIADNATVEFTAGAATSLLVTGISDPFTSGGTSDVTVTVVDQFLNTVTDYTGTISFSSSDLDASVVLPADYTFLLTDAGPVTLAGGVTLITLGEHSVTATDGAISGTQTGITVQ
jgi:Invasin, domain 3